MTRRLERLRQHHMRLSITIGRLKQERDKLTEPSEIETLDATIARYETMIAETSEVLGAREARRLNGAPKRIAAAEAKRKRKAARRLACR